MSFINTQYKNVFVHIPKTAGSFMERMEHVGGTSHSTLEDLSVLPEFDERFVKWTFVRHPVKRLLSAYFYLPIVMQDVKNAYMFDVFVGSVYEEREAFFDKHVHTRPMVDFVRHDSIEMDFVGKHENVEEDWKTLCGMIIDKIEELNTEPHYTIPRDLHKRFLKKKTVADEHFKKVSKGTIKLIEEIYKEDYEKFSY